MKTQLLAFAILTSSLALSTQAQPVEVFQFASGSGNPGSDLLGTAVPDSPGANTPGTAWVNSQTVAGAYDTITDVNVLLNINAGFNSDLKLTLTHDDGIHPAQTVVLINRVGRDLSTDINEATAGYGDSGFGNLTGAFTASTLKLDDTGAGNDIHLYRDPGNTAPSVAHSTTGQAAFNPVTGPYRPDGRTVAEAGDFGGPQGTSPRQNGGNPLALFNGLNANGVWTLTATDNYNGDAITPLSWGLEIVPEPSTYAAIFGVLALGVVTFLKRGSRRISCVSTPA